MNKRIRYIKSPEDNIMIGSKFYKTNNGVEYQICFVSTEGYKCLGTIKTVDGEVVKAIVASSPHKIKIALKKELMELGCEFEAETRAKGETE